MSMKNRRNDTISFDERLEDPKTFQQRSEDVEYCQWRADEVYEFEEWLRNHPEEYERTVSTDAGSVM